MRWMDPELALGAALVEREDRAERWAERATPGEPSGEPSDVPSDQAEAAVFRKRRIYIMGIGRNRLEQAIRELGLPAVVSRDETQADAILVLKSVFRKQPDRVDAAQAARIPVYVLRSAGLDRLREALATIFQADLGESRHLLPEPPTSSDD